MEFLKGAIQVLGAATGANTPYTRGALIASQPGNTLWTLYSGVRTADSLDVSIFFFDGQKAPERLPLAKNAFKRFRTLRHPSIVGYLDGTETPTSVEIVTEQVTPLSHVLRGLMSQNMTGGVTDAHSTIMWGLYKLAHLLKFLNQDGSIVHGNIRIDSIFVTKAGEWKLGGMEMASSMKEDNSALYSIMERLFNYEKYLPPEMRLRSPQPNMTKTVDSYAYGCLVHELYNGPGSLDHVGQTRDNIPSGLFPYVRSLVASDSKLRSSFDTFLTAGSAPGSFFDNELIKAANFLENITLKDQDERDAFVSHLDEVASELPDEFCRYKVLPELRHALEFGGAGPKVLGLVLKISSKLPKDEFEQTILRSIIKMFSSPDRQTRIALLDNLPHFIDSFDAKVLNDKVFPQIVLGFSDTIPFMREHTLKSMLLLIPKLNERTINNDLLRYLAKLQADEEAGIRTNTTVLLGKMSKHLSDATRKRVLIPAFVRSLRDPFPPARIAGLLAMAATSDFHDPPEVAVRALPAISPLLVDPDKQVRESAFRAMETLLEKLGRLSAEMVTKVLLYTSPFLTTDIHG
ncbi:ARM repeat-containing protein [Gonapodya prolifera JEL478]|uniref:ARM repeat-containing protein n=1 Tax=Gonapodya prolifera (strain JEL478) TaxID=1344416 RepID=A0A139ARP2_GONPJ|nr:ARM repeat-containing protein [Gonapodya prolifera JEL478]|eukprot:KXS19203.1 ARM repeat-containing protein [Gonapodya prolifera JEL478]